MKSFLLGGWDSGSRTFCRSRSCSSLFLSLSSLFSLPQIICFRWLLDMLIPKISLKFFPLFCLELIWDSCPFNSKTSSRYVSSCLYPRSVLKLSDANLWLTIVLREHKISVVYLFLYCCFLLRQESWQILWGWGLPIA